MVHIALEVNGRVEFKVSQTMTIFWYPGIPAIHNYQKRKQLRLLHHNRPYRLLITSFWPMHENEVIGYAEDVNIQDGDLLVGSFI